MDADELNRIAAVFVLTVAEAGALVKEVGIGPDFRNMAQHAREMHDLFLEAMMANGPLHTSYLLGVYDTAGNMIDAGVTC